MDYTNLTMDDWKQEDLRWCGANRYIAGDRGKDFDSFDNIFVYYNVISKNFYLDQPDGAKSLVELKMQLRKLLERLEKIE